MGPLLKDAVLRVDYKDYVLWCSKITNFDAAGYASIAMLRNHRLLTVAMRADGVLAPPSGRTGNDGGVHLFPAFVKEHALRDKSPGLVPYRGLSGSGRVFRILRGAAEQVSIGAGTTLQQVSMAFVSQAFDPAWEIDEFVGYQVLSRLKPCLDRRGQRMF